MTSSFLHAAVVPALRAPGGVSDFGTVNNSSTIKLNGTMTLEAWLYPTGWRSYSGREKHGLNFMYKGRIGSHIDYMFSLQANGYLCYGNTRGTIGILRPVVPLNQWTHVAVSINEAAGSIRFYVNGVDQGGYGTWGGGVDRNNPILPSDHPLYIGGFNQMGWGYNNDNFIGKIGDVRIWSTARSAQEIADNYRKQLKGDEAGLNAYWTFADRFDKSGKNNHMTLTGNAAFQAGEGPDLQGASGGIQVAITAPTNNAIVIAGSEVVISASAINTNGVSQVGFYRGSNLIGVDNSAPFSIVYSNFPAGTHTFSARATNNNGEVGTSADITLKAQGPYNGVMAQVPGWIQYENYDVGGQDVAFNDTTSANEGGQYRTSNGVDISADGSASNGHIVGWTKAGEWLEYTINVASSGFYNVRTRVAAAGVNGQFRIRLNGVDKSGAVNVPNTGAWNAYQFVTVNAVEIPAGVHTVRVDMAQNGQSGFVGAFDAMLIGEAPPPPPPPPPPEQGAYPNGVPWALPGTVEFENYDTGGVNVAYFDTTAGNAGGAYRNGEGVDVGPHAAAGNGHVVGWTKAGEWIEYKVQVAATGVYDLDVRVAAVGNGGQFRVEVNGADKTGSWNIPNTGAWINYVPLTKTNVMLDSGIHTVRVVMVANGASGFVGAFDWFRFRAALAPGQQTAHPAGVPPLLPGIIECENFDDGGPGVAYQDSTPANLGGHYRDSHVDVVNDPQASNGRTVGWTHEGEWKEFTFRIDAVSGFGHWWQTRVAAVGTGGQFRVEINGVDVTGTLNVPNTGAWNNYTVINSQLANGVLPVGVHTARLVMVRNGVSGFVGAFDRFSITDVNPPPPSLAGRASSTGVSSGILSIQSSQEADQPGAAEAAVDGKSKTVWTGVEGAGGWWLALTFDPTRTLRDVEIDWAGEPVEGVQYRASLDATSWSDLALPVEGDAIPLNYLWIVIPDAGQTPSIREIRLK